MEDERNEQWADPAVAEQVLRSFRVWAVVGCSSRPWRASHGVSRYLLSQGYDVVPINPKEKAVHGRVAYPDLRSIPADRDAPIEVVDLFRRSDLVMPHVEEAIEIGAKAVWMQLDVWNEEAAQLAADAGLLVVMDRCPAIDHPAMIGARLGVAPQDQADVPERRSRVGVGLDAPSASVSAPRSHSRFWASKLTSASCGQRSSIRIADLVDEVLDRQADELVEDGARQVGDLLAGHVPRRIVAQDRVGRIGVASSRCRTRCRAAGRVRSGSVVCSSRAKSAKADAGDLDQLQLAAAAARGR